MPKMKNRVAIVLLSSLLGFGMVGCNDSSSSSTTTTTSTDTSTVVTTRTWTDVAYASTSASQKMDIYLPSTGSGPFPTVIWIHGGAFKFGDKARPQSLTALNTAGYAVVSVNYRLSGEAQWPAQLDDLKSIVTYLRTNASTYALDKTKFAAWGASAGGHLASMMGIALADNADTRIQAVVDWFGPMDFYYMDEDMVASGVTRCTGANGDASSPESVLIGATVSANKTLSDAASPLSYLAQLPASTTVPPFFIMHGLMDCNIAPKQSERLHTALQAKWGASASTYNTLANAGHGTGDFKETYVETMVIDFLNAQLK